MNERIECCILDKERDNPFIDTMNQSGRFRNALMKYWLDLLDTSFYKSNHYKTGIYNSIIVVKRNYLQKIISTRVGHVLLNFKAPHKKHDLFTPRNCIINLGRYIVYIKIYTTIIDTNLLPRVFVILTILKLIT